MDKTIEIGLSGHPERYRLQPDAYARLETYLDNAATRLRNDPDRAEVLGDLERSIGDRLTAAIGSEDRLITAADMTGVLEAMGNVDTGHDVGAGDTTEGAGPKPRKRKLQRIRQGQQFAGVCTGLADYAELRVDWVRVGFIFATLLTGGLFLLAYIALAFIMPVSESGELV